MQLLYPTSKAYEDYREQWRRAGEGLITAAPTHLDLELVRGCNAACVYCPASKEKQKPVFMNTNNAIALLKQAKEINVQSVKFNWRGEATLHPDFAEIIDYAKGLDFVDLMLNTNGMYPNSLTRSISKLDTIIFSIDGSRQITQTELRCGTMLEIIWGNIGVLLDEISHPLIKVNFTECKENENEKEKVRAQCAGKGIKFVCRKEAPRTGNGRINLPRKPCPFPFQRLTVAYDGRVAPCCVPWDDNFYIGDLNKQTLLDIWHGDRIKRIREDAMAVNYREEACLNCTSYQAYKI
ncbi:MAG: radical SAM/SPASM domain-containing protein [Endomicrobiia bacterium]|nr:radical SAM/SPASM domain-containing protein [Endomicrobiia bacterium]